MSKIKIYTNENVPIAIVKGLRRRGIEASSARDVGNLGMSDEEHLKWAMQNKYIIFTYDDDLVRICHKWRGRGIAYGGVIYVSHRKLSIGECIRRLEIIASVLSSEDMKDHIEFL